METHVPNTRPVKPCILDYGSGNVRSVFNLLSTISAETTISNDPDFIRSATHLILPGVGAFGAAMSRIHQRIPLNVVEEVVLEQRRPFLGICVGYQVLMETGSEFGESKGLGWLEGTVDQLDSAEFPLPHIGWNGVDVKCHAPLFEGIASGEDFYFVHSFVVRLRESKDVAATTEYGERFASAASHCNIHGVQFHPEKSQRAGRRLIENFFRMP